jgi:hypothetical protein
MEFVVVSGLIAAFGGLVAYVNRQHRKYMEWLKQIGADGSYRDYFYHGTIEYRIDTPFVASKQGQKNLLLITHKRMALYHYPQVEPLFTIQPHELRGFWRPEKYNDALNEMWIHAQIGLTWHILKVQLYKFEMQKLVRAMKAIATEEQVKGYRRHRPHVHRDPCTAFPATQNLHGAWELDAPVNLYIMPLELVIFHGQEVHDTIELALIQNIAALRRMEGGKPDGLVRFMVESETYAFALDNYEAWASDLAEAAKRTLEEPVERKRKGKDEDEDEE